MLKTALNKPLPKILFNAQQKNRVWEDAHKKVFLVVEPLRGRGKTPWTTKKKNTFFIIKKKYQNFMNHKARGGGYPDLSGPTTKMCGMCVFP